MVYRRFPLPLPIRLVLLGLGVGGYVKLESKDVTKDAIATLLADYRAGKLELQSPNPAR